MNSVSPEIAALIDESRLSESVVYKEAPGVIYVDECVVGTIGNFSAFIGKAKSKKTFNVSAITAAALSGRTVLRYTVVMPPSRPVVLYIDTEQGRTNCQRVLRRINRLAGLSDEEDNPNLIYLSLRKYDPGLRVQIIEGAIKSIEGIGLVIIDGVRDCLYDINSPAEATGVTSLLMKWTDEHRIHLHTILHQNKGDENARGHIGTEINNKAESVIQIEKDKDNADISKVTPVYTRDREFEPFAFVVNDAGLPELAEDYIFTDSKRGRPAKAKFEPMMDITKEQHIAAMERVFPDDKGEYSREQLLPLIKEAYAQVCNQLFGNNKISALLTALTNRRIIIHTDPNSQKSPYCLNPERPF